MHLNGPNLWTYRPVIEAWVDIGAFEDFPSNTLPGFNERLLSWLPGLIEHRCGIGERGGFVERLKSGTWLGHVLEHVTIELQNLSGMKVGFGKARQTAEGSGIYKVAVRTRNELVGRRAIVQARDLIMAAVEGQPFDIASVVAELTDMVDRHCLGPSTACIVDAAGARGIPFIRLNDGNLVQLGYGAKQRRIWTAETDSTSAIAEGISRDKDLTKNLLRSCGIPIPQGAVVASPGQAWEEALEIGLPVVVKPLDGNHGRGVSLELNNREDVEAAYHVASKEGSGVLVEQYIRGSEHRLLVVGGKVVAAIRGEEIYVTGDGVSSVQSLIDRQLNSDPRRGEAEEFPLDYIALDKFPSMVLELGRQGFSATSVPAKGLKVLIQRNGNVSMDCTNAVHPQVDYLAGLAARVVGLDIAGIDLVAQDISRPLDEQGAAIIEVNAGPSLLMHIKPAQGDAQPVGEAIVRHLFKPEKEESGLVGRIPVVGICGMRGTSTIARFLACLVHFSGRHVGLACRDGLFLDQRRVDKRDSTGYEAGQRLLMNRCIDAAIIETPPLSILSEGLPYDRCQVGLVTDMEMDGRGSYDAFFIDTLERLAQVVRTQVDVVLPKGIAVLNADDVSVAALAPLCDGAVVFYSSAPESESPRLILGQHIQGGGRAVISERGTIFLVDGRVRTALDLVVLRHPMEILLPVIAAAWSLGLSGDLIAAGIESFEAGTGVGPCALLPSDPFPGATSSKISG